MLSNDKASRWRTMTRRYLPAPQVRPKKVVTSQIRLDRPNITTERQPRMPAASPLRLSLLPKFVATSIDHRAFACNLSGAFIQQKVPQRHKLTVLSFCLWPAALFKELPFHILQYLYYFITPLSASSPVVPYGCSTSCKSYLIYLEACIRQQRASF